MIHVDSVHRSFGRVRAVRGVSFDLARGQVAGLLGPNGAGKSTTIRMITGFLPPDRGRIEVAGFDIERQSIGARRCLGYLPESAPAYPEMRVLDFLSFRARLHGLTGRARSSAIARSIERCWLKDVRTRRVGHLSKGYRQRTGLAAALLHDPQVLILDEPTNGLDPTQIRESRTLIRELGQDKTVLVSSHILAEVELVCDHVIIIARGRVMASGAPASLIAPLRDKAPYIVEFKSETLADDAAAGVLRGVPGVAEVSVNGGGEWSCVRIEPSPEAADLREPVSRALGSAGVVIRELRRESPTLESVFLRCIHEDTQA